ncbi:DinB family protein [Paenibacillus sp. NPDC058071]|uniref:DinB family protein n=1 Tax=Paenibacillus sp. NPDC058071 TaxID=3346326 RepID=UPI0036DB6E0B
MTQSSKEQLVAAYKAGGEALAKAVLGLSEAELLHHRLPEKWSVKQIAVHLADAELAVSFRVRNILSEKDPAIQPFEQDNWTDSLNYEALDLAAALERFRLLRTANSELLERIGDAEWERTGAHPENGLITLEQLIAGQINHLQGHLDQIQASIEDYRSR